MTEYSTTYIAMPNCKKEQKELFIAQRGLNIPHIFGVGV